MGTRLPVTKQSHLCAGAAVLSLVAAEFAAAQVTWTAQGGNALWSNPVNWSPPGVPPAGSDLHFVPAGGVVIQDLTEPPVVRSMQFGNVSPYTFSGNPIRMMDGGGIVQPIGADFRCELNLLGAVSVQTYFPPVVFRNISGPGGLSFSGTQDLVSALVDVATNSGVTTIDSGTLRVGGVAFIGGDLIQVPGSTAGQGDYRVKRFAELGGVGAIGLAPGKKIYLDGGTLDPGPGALPYDPGALIINGDLVFGPGSFYRCETLGSVFDHVTVNGTLDLSAAQDVIAVAPNVLNGTVVMSYLSRFGEFDQVFVPAGAQLIYTSPPNSGPGQVMVLIPEVNGSVIVGIIGAATITRRRVRRL